MSPPLAIRPNDEAVVSAAAWGTGEARSSEHGHETTQSRRVVIIACSVDGANRNAIIGAVRTTNGVQTKVNRSIAD